MTSPRTGVPVGAATVNASACAVSCQTFAVASAGVRVAVEVVVEERGWFRLFVSVLVDDDVMSVVWNLVISFATYCASCIIHSTKHIELICHQCSKHYIILKCILKNRKNNSKFCSKICKNNSLLNVSRPQKTKEKISNSLKGRTSPNKGKEVRWMIGKKNYNWKGGVAYVGNLHVWVRRNKGNAKICVDCGASSDKRVIQWSNIDHKYRKNLDDFVGRCVSCHKFYDYKNFILPQRQLIVSE